MKTLRVLSAIVVASLLCSTLLREPFHGTALIAVSDVIALFGGLSLLAVGALYVFERSGAREVEAPTAAEASHQEGRLPEPENHSHPAASDKLTDLPAICGGLLKAVGIALLVFVFMTVFYEGLIIAPLVTAPYLVAYFGGHAILGQSTNIPPAARFAGYLLTVIVCGWLWSIGFRDITGKSAYLIGYGAEALICMVGNGLPMLFRQPARDLRQ